MTLSQSKKNYDVVFIGTGMIPAIEAVHQSLCGKSVLMIDEQDSFGGAWRSLELFGLHDVENAIHYLLPDSEAPPFMRDVLNWDVIESPRKFRVFDLPVVGRCKLPYDNRFGRLITRLFEARMFETERSTATIIEAIKDELLGIQTPSYYVKGGVPEMLSKVHTILAASNVKIRYSTFVDCVHVDTDKRIVEISMGSEKIYSNVIVFSHGSKIKKLTSPAGSIQIEETIHPRPAVHLSIRDTSPSDIFECIFVADELIKYAHDVTRFTREAQDLIGKRKIVVLALRHEIRSSDGLYPQLLEKLKWAGMVGNHAVLEGHSWWDVVLPAIDDSALENIKLQCGQCVEFLKTENFARGIGYHAKKWSSTIKLPRESVDLHFASRTKDNVYGGAQV